MNSSLSDPRATRIWFDKNNLWLELVDGRQLSVPFAYFPRLLHASPEQRQRYEISGGGTGLHWDELDEDISVAGLLAGVGDRTKRRSAVAGSRS
jgi:hypothetical protein